MITACCQAQPRVCCPTCFFFGRRPSFQLPHQRVKGQKRFPCQNSRNDASSFGTVSAKQKEMRPTGVLDNVGQQSSIKFAIKLHLSHSHRPPPAYATQEVQIHGEVNLKKHVQRLVAASKYRDVPKTQRLALKSLVKLTAKQSENVKDC